MRKPPIQVEWTWIACARGFKGNLAVHDDVAPQRVQDYDQHQTRQEIDDDQIQYEYVCVDYSVCQNDEA